MVSLISMARLYYEVGSISKGLETLDLILMIARSAYKPSSEWNRHVANMLVFYEHRVLDHLHSTTAF